MHYLTSQQRERLRPFGMIEALDGASELPSFERLCRFAERFASYMPEPLSPQWKPTPRGFDNLARFVASVDTLTTFADGKRMWSTFPQSMDDATGRVVEYYRKVDKDLRETLRENRSLLHVSATVEWVNVLWYNDDTAGDIWGELNELIGDVATEAALAKWSRARLWVRTSKKVRWGAWCQVIGDVTGSYGPVDGGLVASTRKVFLRVEKLFDTLHHSEEVGVVFMQPSSAAVTFTWMVEEAWRDASSPTRHGTRVVMMLPRTVAAVLHERGSALQVNYTDPSMAEVVLGIAAGWENTFREMLEAARLVRA